MSFICCSGPIAFGSSPGHYNGLVFLFSKKARLITLTKTTTVSPRLVIASTDSVKRPHLFVLDERLNHLWRARCDSLESLRFVSDMYFLATISNSLPTPYSHVSVDLPFILKAYKSTILLYIVKKTKFYTITIYSFLFYNF